MSKALSPISILTALLLPITCAACGRAALSPQPRPNTELRPLIHDDTHHAWERDTNGSTLDNPASERALRRLADDSLQDLRATRSGWAASAPR